MDLEKLLRKEYHKNGKSIKQIVKEFNIHSQKIRYCLRLFNIPVKPKGNRSGIPHRTKGYVLLKDL